YRSSCRNFSCLRALLVAGEPTRELSGRIGPTARMCSARRRISLERHAHAGRGAGAVGAALEAGRDAEGFEHRGAPFEAAFRDGALDDRRHDAFSALADLRALLAERLRVHRARHGDPGAVVDEVARLRRAAREDDLPFAE